MRCPKFSVIIPVYNTEKYLDEAVESVLAQKEKSYEVLLIDDGSTDKSGEICDKWALEDERIKVFHQKNMGQIAARECGINNATGDYVVFLDSDDLLDCDTLNILDEEIKTNNADCVVYGYRKLENGKFYLGTVAVDEERKIVNDINTLFRIILSDSSYNSMCRKAFRRDLIHHDDYSNSYHLRHGEDLVQSLMILYRCRTVVFLNRVLYTYRILSTSISHNRNLNDYTECFGALEVIYDLLNQYDVINCETVIYYKRQCIKHFAKMIISMLDEEQIYKRKITKLKEMRELPWFDILESGKLDVTALNNKDKMIMWLFTNRHMNTLVCIFKCWRIVRHN